MTPPKPTLYHDSVDHLRRDLMTSYDQYEKAVQEYRPQSLAGSGPAQATAYMSSLAAKGYAYTLAAVLGYAGRKFGTDVAHELACIADDIMNNGDDENINADVMPAEAQGGAR